MKIAGSFCAALAGVATIVDQVTAREAGFVANRPVRNCWPFREIDHDSIYPFDQPIANTTKEKAAVNHKPFLKVDGGCDPYPAVTPGGHISSGLKPEGSDRFCCDGNEFESQVYARSEWYEGHWYIAFVYYFPKENAYGAGHRHGWQTCVVWLSNPDPKKSKILGVSVSGENGFVIHAPPLPNTVDGTRVKLRYFKRAFGTNDPASRYELETTEEKGGDQDLIQWHQLTDP